MNEEKLIDVKQDADGAIDFASIKAEKISLYWKKAFKENLKIQDKLKAKNKIQAKENKSSLVESFNEYFSSGKMGQALLEYLYSGDKNLNLKSNGRDGIAIIIARSLAKFRSINTLYYFHIKNISTGNFTELFASENAKIDFTKNVAENALSLIKDIWNFEIIKENSPKNDDSLAIAQCIESNIFYYEHLEMPVRQLRFLGLIAGEKSLPALPEIKQRYHIISALSMDSFEDLKAKHSEKFPCEIITYKAKTHKSNANLINALIEDLSKIWELHKKSLSIAHQEDVEIFNAKIAFLIDNLTTGFLREAQREKNKTTGEDTRLSKKLMARLEKDPEFIKKVAKRDALSLELLQEDLDSYSNKKEPLELLIKLAISLEKTPEAISRLKKLSPLNISINSVVALDKLEREFSEQEEPKDIISPDDFSMQIWENLKDSYKLFMMCVCLGCVSKRAFVEEFNKYLERQDRLALRYIRLNIYCIVLEKLTGEKLEVANGINPELLKMKIREIALSKACHRDFTLNVSMLFGRASEILEEKDASATEESLAQKAYAIFDELNKEK